MAGMSTTLSAVALFDEGRYVVANVGDSRTYLLRDGRLTLLTRDDSFVQELLDATTSPWSSRTSFLAAIRRLPGPRRGRRARPRDGIVRGVTSASIQPARRSCLSVPASSERKLEKAPGLGADEVVIDLEDAVAPAAKDDARAAAVAALADAAWDAQTVSVRVNAPRSAWCHLDVAALAAVERLDAIVVPKVESAGDLAFIDRLLDGAKAGRTRPLRVQALIETAAGLANVTDIASERLDALILGYADLAASLGRTTAGANDLAAWLPAQHAVLVAARAHGLQAIDGPHLGVAVDDAFTAAATRTRDLGFDGKWAIHPAQVAAINELFTPSAEEVERARAVVATLARSETETGQGAVALDGEMVDEAVRVAALRVLARAGAAA
jgi:citrate lyase subunit beta/citryl-CoA lyase